MIISVSENPNYKLFPSSGDFTSADNLCKHFGPRSGWKSIKPDLVPNLDLNLDSPGIPERYFGIDHFLKNMQESSACMWFILDQGCNTVPVKN